MVNALQKWDPSQNLEEGQIQQVKIRGRESFLAEVTERIRNFMPTWAQGIQTTKNLCLAEEYEKRWEGRKENT